MTFAQAPKNKTTPSTGKHAQARTSKAWRRQARLGELGAENHTHAAATGAGRCSNVELAAARVWSEEGTALANQHSAFFNVLVSLVFAAPPRVR